MRKKIGIVGGLGPFTGLDINRKIFNNTMANCDKDHLEVFLLSRSEAINDRTSYLLGETDTNPAYEVYKTIDMLEKIGADIACIPCNTCHAPKIYKVIKRLMKKNRNRIMLLNIVKETYNYFLKNHFEFKNIGLLATQGTYTTNLYRDIFEKEGKLKIIYPAIETQRKVNDAIYNKKYGIKKKCNPTSDIAKGILKDATKELKLNGAQAVIMGCTEIPIALDSIDTGIMMVDPNIILARALIEIASKEQLIPMTVQKSTITFDK